MPSNHLILCHHLLLLPSIFPSIRVFFNELALLHWVMERQHQSFQNEYSRLSPFRIDWFDLPAVLCGYWYYYTVQKVVSDLRSVLCRTVSSFQKMQMQLTQKVSFFSVTYSHTPEITTENRSVGHLPEHIQGLFSLKGITYSANCFFTQDVIEHTFMSQGAETWLLNLCLQLPVNGQFDYFHFLTMQSTARNIPFQSFSFPKEYPGRRGWGARAAHCFYPGTVLSVLVSVLSGSTVSPWENPLHVPKGNRSPPRRVPPGGEDGRAR